jgi:DNA-binding HxlR family transcriptional regulator
MSKMCQKYEKASQLLGKRWIAMIVYEMLKGPRRFHDLEIELNISAKMLSERLKYLEIEEIIKRNVYIETPIRIEYELTEKGKTLKPIIDQISNWSQAWF